MANTRRARWGLPAFEAARAGLACAVPAVLGLWAVATAFTDRPNEQAGTLAAHLMPALAAIAALGVAMAGALAWRLARRAERLEEENSQARCALADMQGRLGSLGKSLPAVLATVRLEGEQVRFSHASESAQHYYGVPAQAMLADPRAWAAHADPQDVKALREGFRALRDGDEYVLSRAVRVTGGDGVRRTLQTTLVRRDDGASRTFDWISLDISDLIAARGEAESASRAKSDFLATMSHELRTPLNAIMGFSRVLEETLAEREQQRQARFVRETAQVLTRILNDVLDLAKVDAGRFALDPRPFDLAQVVDNCRTLYRVVAAEKGLLFQVEAPSGQTPLVGDPIRLRQVLENLLSNAFKFTASGGVSLKVSLEPLDYAPTPQALVTLQLVDTGIGMTEEQLTRVFERFEQADRIVKMRYGGAGLGLAVVETLVEKMGGTIRVYSQEGVGTEFTLAIPFDIGQAADAPPPEVPLSVLERPLRVLVADDLSLNRIVIGAQLQTRGHTVIEAQDGVEALQKVLDERPDLVLMDLDMPTLDGLEATRRLRAQELGRRVPVWALTGKTFAEDIEACREAGMDGHLAKPVSLEDLVRVLRTVEPA